MPDSHITEILEFALSLARVADQQILPIYRHSTVTLKSDGTEVTEADRNAEKAMREVIGMRYPDHAVLGEEFGGPAESTGKPLWVLDPVDGTASFALGIPIFGSLIGYVENGEPQAGVIHFPAMGETVYAAKGLGCWVKVGDESPQRVTVSRVSDLRDAYVSACSVRPSDIYPVHTHPSFKLSSVIVRARRFRFITDCLQHALVAQGRIDAALDLIMHPWDIAAIVPCVEEAGGVVSDLHGNREGIIWQSSLLTSSHRSLHDRIVALLNDRRL